MSGPTQLTESACEWLCGKEEVIDQVYMQGWNGTGTVSS